MNENIYNIFFCFCSYRKMSSGRKLSSLNCVELMFCLRGTIMWIHSMPTRWKPAQYSCRCICRCYCLATFTNSTCMGRKNDFGSTSALFTNFAHTIERNTSNCINLSIFFHAFVRWIYWVDSFNTYLLTIRKALSWRSDAPAAIQSDRKKGNIHNGCVMNWWQWRWSYHIHKCDTSRD